LAQYIVKPAIVAACLEELRNQRIHNNFAGYLCVKRTAFRDERNDNLQVNFKEFFDTFFRVGDAPSDKPYAMPFWDAPPSEANKWFNENVAGSYAPSSLRSGSPFRKVIKVEGSRRASDIRYSLLEDDAKLALKHLLYNTKVPALCLATFLYRDFAVETDGDEEPTPHLLVRIFQEEFGFIDETLDPIGDDFETLFSYNSKSAEGETDWFESL
jgi:hypothetical protein